MKAGRVLHLAKSGRLIIRAETMLKPGQILIDDKGQKIAKNIEIFGSVAHPYFAAAIISKSERNYVGSDLFTLETESFGERRKNRRRHN